MATDSGSSSTTLIAGAAASTRIDEADAPAAEPTAASVSFITTEHFTLQGERS